MKAPERDYSHRSLLDKLGVKPEHRAAAIGAHAAAFLRELKSRLAVPAAKALRGEFDLIFLHVDVPGDLARIESACKHLVPNGALWIFHPKGKKADPHDAEVRAAGLAAGLVDNKISALSDTHTATRYVIPIPKRG